MYNIFLPLDSIAKLVYRALFNWLNDKHGQFPGAPVVRTWRFHCEGSWSIPDRGTKIPQAVGCTAAYKKERQTCTYKLRN